MSVSVITQLRRVSSSSISPSTLKLDCSVQNLNTHRVEVQHCCEAVFGTSRGNARIWRQQTTHPQLQEQGMRTKAGGFLVIAAHSLCSSLPGCEYAHNLQLHKTVR